MISNTPFLIAKRNKSSYTWTLIITSLQTGWEFHQEFVITSALFTAGAQFSLWPLKSPHPSELGAPHQTCPWWWPGANKQQINDENNKTWLLTWVLTTRLIDATRRSFCSWKETKPGKHLRPRTEHADHQTAAGTSGLVFFLWTGWVSSEPEPLPPYASVPSRSYLQTATREGFSFHGIITSL